MSKVFLFCLAMFLLVAVFILSQTVSDVFLLLGLMCKLFISGEFARRELQTIATDPDETNFIEVQNFINLFNITNQIIDLVCNSKYIASNEKLSMGFYANL